MSDPEQKDEAGPADDLLYYANGFGENILDFFNTENEEEKKNYVRWAYASLIWLEDESKAIRRNMRTKFQLKDADIKTWMEQQEKEEAAKATETPDNVPDNKEAVPEV